MPSAGPRKMHWCITDWPTEEATNEPQFNANDMNYLIYGNETSEAGVQHWQGYVQFKKAIARNKVKSYFSNATHCEPAMGSPQQASDYCKKDGDFKEFGTISKPGKRNDLLMAKDMMDKGASVTQVADECFGVFCRYTKAINEYVQLKLPSDRTCFTKDYCTILWGDPGSGKSRTAYNCDSYQVLQYDPKSRFFSAPWDGSKRVIIDDVCPATFVPRELWLNIMDPYARQLRINVKGSNSKFAPTELVLTSNYDPATWMPGDAAFQRRLDEFCTIKHMQGFVDVAMRRFFEPQPVGAAAMGDTEPIYITDSDSECGSAVDWAESSNDDDHSSYSRRVRQRICDMGNERAAGSEYHREPTPEVRCRYAEEAEEGEDSINSDDARGLLALSRYERRARLNDE